MKKCVMKGGEVVLFFSLNERQLWPCWGSGQEVDGVGTE